MPIAKDVRLGWIHTEAAEKYAQLGQKFHAEQDQPWTRFLNRRRAGRGLFEGLLSVRCHEKRLEVDAEIAVCERQGQQLCSWRLPLRILWVQFVVRTAQISRKAASFWWLQRVKQVSLAVSGPLYWLVHTKGLSSCVPSELGQNFSHGWMGWPKHKRHIYNEHNQWSDGKDRPGPGF